MNMTDKVKVTRRQSQTFALCAEQFCRWCGARGVYEREEDEEDRAFCFRCTDSRPFSIYAPDSTLPALLRGEDRVLDCRVWEEGVTVFESEVEKQIRALSALLCRDLYGGGAWCSTSMSR